jgi:EmrB/QacA subfamily drug resistance transporter
MNRYILGYTVGSLLLVFLANWLMVRSGQRKAAAAAEGAYSPLPKPSDSLVEMADELAEGSETLTRAKAAKPGDIKIGQLMTVIMLGAFIAILNQTLINVAIPHIMIDFNVSANVVQWLVTGYMLVNGVMIPITAFLIERFGSRRMFIIAMVLFTIGAMICALAPSFGVMMMGRVVQATGAGIIMPLMMTIILTVFPTEKRGMAMAMMGIVLIFAPAIGPTLSGWIVQTYTWRILFYIVLPISVIDIVLALLLLTNVTKISKVTFDFWGFLFSTIGFGGLLYAFSEAGSLGWSSGVVLVTLAIGVISLILFVWREFSVEEPMLNLRVFSYDIFTLTTIVGSIINMALFAAMILLPIYLQNIRGFTPLESGLLLLPGAVLMGIMQPIAGKIFDRSGARLLAIIGLVITTFTTWEFSKLTGDTSYAHVMLLYCMRMFGMSFLMMPVMTEGMNQLPRRLTAHGTATSNTMRQVAGSLGTALLVSVMSNRANFHMGNISNAVTTSNPFIVSEVSRLGNGVAAMSGGSPEMGSRIVIGQLYGSAMTESTINGINDAFVVATLITVVALVLAFFIRRARHPEEDEPQG